MQIRLSSRGPVMWFLGDPRNLIVALNIQNPSAEVDFDKLKDGEQKKILNSLRLNQIECSESYESLHARWARNDIPDVPEEDKNDYLLQIELAKKMEEKRMAAEERKIQAEQEALKRCKNILQKPAEKIKYSILREKDIRFLNLLLKTEQAEQNRSDVIEVLQNRKKKCLIAKQKKADQQVNKATKEYVKVNKGRQIETIDMPVVESEYRTIVLTPEELIDAAYKRK
jgi:hypothetical protein